MRDGVGRDESKKSKPIPTSSCGAGLKSCPILAPPPLRGGENPHGAKRGGAGQAGRGKIAIPTTAWYLLIFVIFKILFLKYLIYNLSCYCITRQSFLVFFK